MIEFANLALIRKRIDLAEQDTPVFLGVSPLDHNPEAYGGLILSVHHVEGTIYDVVVAITLYPDDFLDRVQQVKLENLADAFDLITEEEGDPNA